MADLNKLLESCQVINTRYKSDFEHATAGQSVNITEILVWSC